MSKTAVVRGCAWVLLALCCVQQVGCLHLRKHLTSYSTNAQVTHSRNKQTDGDSEMFSRYRRFNRLHICDTDLDCAGRNRPSCCAYNHESSIRLCEPLGTRGSMCNTFSRPHMWSGERLGKLCPCEAGLECVSDSSSSLISRGTCI